MKIDNPLSQEFLLQYPAEAARTLEQVSFSHVAALFNTLAPSTGASVMAFMLPDTAAACLELMEIQPAAKLVAGLPISIMARIYQLLTPRKQGDIFDKLSDKSRNQIRRYLRYPSASAGALMEPNVDILPESVTVADAIRRLERIGRPANCEIYITDESHHLVGVVELGRLLTSVHHAELRDIMSRKTQRISVHATVASLLSHPGWASRRSLPVIERNNTLVGALQYSQLQKAASEAGANQRRDPLEEMMSLASLYWISLAQLLDSVLNIPVPGKGEQP